MPTFEAEFVQRYGSLADFAREDGCYRIYRYARQPGTEITASAGSLKKAERKIEGQVPEGHEIISKQVVSDGEPVKVWASAETEAAAFEKAEGMLPDRAEILNKRSITGSNLLRYSSELAVANEKVAIGWARRGFTEQLREEFGEQPDFSMRVISVQETRPAKKGFLGIGSEYGRFKVELGLDPLVEISYRSKAVVTARINRLDLYFTVRRPEDEQAMRNSASVHDPVLVWSAR